MSVRKLILCPLVLNGFSFILVNEIPDFLIATSRDTEVFIISCTYPRFIAALTPKIDGSKYHLKYNISEEVFGYIEVQQLFEEAAPNEINDKLKSMAQFFLMESDSL